MPLTATDFMVQGPTPTATAQLYSLLTGAIKDQPVTLGDTVSIGGDQHIGDPALRVYGDIELYASRLDDTPGFGLGPGGFQWGSTFFQPAPLGGLRVGPSLEVIGDLHVGGTIHGDIPWDEYYSTYLRELRPGVLIMEQMLVVGDVNPWQAGLQNARGQFIVRAPDLAGSSTAASFICWAGNWLQFNVRFWNVDASQGWPGKKLTLDFDADNMPPGTAGRITFENGKVGIGQITDVEGAILDLQKKVG